MDKKQVKTVIIIAVLISVFVLSYLVIKKYKEDNSLGYIEYLKHYEANEYISTYISDEDMARRYLNDFMYTVYHDLSASYNLLNEEYRDAKFKSINEYSNYIKSLNYPTMDKYYKKDANGYIIFGIYTKDGHYFGFKTKGVMQYSVYLDEETVEIW